MRNIIVFILLAGFSLLVSTGASKKYKFHGMKLQSVKIVKPGDLYSTYDFSDAERKKIGNAVKEDQSIVDEVVKYHHEDNWPEPLNDFNWRISHADVISTFTAYKLCDIGEGRVVLVIPASKNKKVKEVKFSNDIFIVIKQSGIK